MVEYNNIKCSAIEEMREKLSQLLIQEGVTERVIQLSQKLDKKIVMIQEIKHEQFNKKTGSWYIPWTLLEKS